MATPVKLIRRTYRVDKNNDEGTCIGAEEIFLDLSSRDVVFSFFETDTVTLEFSFDSEEYKIEYEDYETGKMIAAKPNEEFDFSYGYDQDRGGYFPGYFSLRLSKGTEKADCWFFVKPKQLGYENVVLLREYVNSYYNGLSLDLERRRAGSASTEFNTEDDSVFMNFYFMENNFPVLTGYMNAYVHDHYEELERRYIVTSHPSSIDGKSMRWMTTKGIRKNSDINHPVSILAKKAVLTDDNRQNRIFRMQVKFWNDELTRSIRFFSNWLSILKGRISIQHREIEKQREKVQKLNSQVTVSKAVRDNAAYRLKDFEKLLASMESIEQSYLDKLHILLRYKTFTDNILSGTWVRNVKDTDDKKGIITDRRLMLIREVQERYTGSRRNSTRKQEKANVDYLAEKSTPRLFETYSYIILLNILTSLDFEIDEETTPPGDLMFTLSNQGRLRLFREDGISCDIYYDCTMDKITKNTEETGYYSFNSRHNKPDFLLSFHSANTDITKAIVIDSKWRSIYSIYNEFEDTEVILALRDYSMFLFYDAEKKQMNRNVIEKVIAVYPDPEERITDILFSQIMALGINICDHLEETESYRWLTEQMKELIGKTDLNQDI